MTFSIAWVTPFGRSSDVSAFSRNILLELAAAIEPKGGTVSVFVNQNKDTYWTALPIVVLSGDSRDREILLSFDYVIFNIGNNSGNHRHINWLVAEVPGIVIVHDMVMQHFFADRLYDTPPRRELYARLIGEYYGEAGLCKIEQSQICSVSQQPIYAPWDSVHVVEMPLLEPFLHCAAAVIVHSQYAERFVAAQFPGPLLRLGLPWDQKPFLSDQEIEEWQTLTAEKTTCSVVCFGYIGRGKCLDLVIAAFGRSGTLRRCAKLTIAGFPGDTAYATELETMIDTMGLRETVRFEGAVSDERLLELKREADVFVNLRDPNTESASGSMIEQMNTGKPLLVYPTGCYAEIDDGAVVKVAKPDGVAGIAGALERIVADPLARIRIGENGRRHVRAIGRREYVRGMMKFIRQQDSLLRQRKRWSTGQRASLLRIELTDSHQAWLGKLIETRRLLAEFRLPRQALSVIPFQHWSAGALVAFVVFGLFGQSAGSAFELHCRALFIRQERQDLFWIVAGARMLWLLSFSNEETSEACYPGVLRIATRCPVMAPEIWGLMRALGEDILAKALYIGLLGRRPGDDEAASYASRLSHDSAESVVREFLFSPEFKSRGAPSASVAELLQWCEKKAPLVAPQLDLGATVCFANHFPDCRRYLGGGWHQVEADQVWSRLPVATVQFSVDDASLSLGVGLVVTGRLTGTARTWARTVKIHCSRGLDTDIAVDNDDWFWFTVELDAAAAEDSNFTVLFDTGTTINPAALGLDQDSRDLGFCLQSISLCLLPAAARVAQDVVIGK